MTQYEVKYTLEKEQIQLYDNNDNFLFSCRLSTTSGFDRKALNLFVKFKGDDKYMINQIKLFDMDEQVEVPFDPEQIQDETVRDICQNIINQYNQWYLSKTCNQTGLLAYFDDENTEKLYNFDQNGLLSSGEDSGINLKFTENTTIPPNARGFKIDFKIQCESDPRHGYLLMPRSSISKTNIRQANCVGLIDAPYRGHIMVKVDNLSDQPHSVRAGESLFQLVLHDIRSNWSLQRVPYLSKTTRGSGGFGSTGK